MGAYLYRCELKAIQAYVLGGRKLLDMAGASALVKELLDTSTQDPNASALLASAKAAGLRQRLGPDKRDDFDGVQVGEWAAVASAAGGATLVFGDGAGLGVFAARLAVEVERRAPGVHLVQAWVARSDEGVNPLTTLVGRLAAARNFPAATLLQPGPVVDAPNQGGRPAVMVDKGEVIDAAVRAQRFRALGRGMYDRLDQAIGRELVPAGWSKGVLEFPTDLAEIGGRRRRGEGGDQDGGYVAVLHADGNGVGQIVMQLNTLADYRDFADALSAATSEAVREAAQATLRPEADVDEREGAQLTLPARPVVIGGDDVTVIVRADRAVAFAEAFAQAFERLTGESNAIRRFNKGRGLTAAAGIVFVKHTHPFRAAYHQAEALTARAKNLSRELSTVAFERVTTSLIEEEQASVEVEVEVGKVKVYTSGNAYVFGALPADGPLASMNAFRSLEGLRTLQGVLADDVPRGPARELARLIEIEPDQARAAWDRLVQVQRGRTAPSGEDRAAALSRVVNGLCLNTSLKGPVLTANISDGKAEPGDRATKRRQEMRMTPWLDAVVLNTIGALSVNDLKADERFIEPNASPREQR